MMLTSDTAVADFSTPETRTSVRIANDAYYTPDALATALVAKLNADGFWSGGHVLEPSAGGGAFVRAAAAIKPHPQTITAIDIDPVANDRLRRSDTPARVVHQDFRDAVGEYELIVGNPPFSAAQEHTELALSRRSEAGTVAFLLRLAFLETQGRAQFWRDNPASKVYVLSERPSFTGGKTDSCAYGFFVWQRGWRDPTELEVISWRGRT